MRFLSILILGCLLSACAHRTLYHPQDELGGYADEQLRGGMFVARFSGNSHTSANDANMFAAFRAIELCKKMGFKFAKILKVENRSTNTAVQRTSSFIYPSSFGGAAYGDSYSSNESYNFPVFDAYFSCLNQTYMIGVELKQLKDEEMKDVTKDKLGAVQVVNVDTDSPNQGIFEIGDFVLKINGKRVRNYPEFSQAVDVYQNKDQIPANIIREGNSMKVMFKAKDATDSYLQINQKVIRAACSLPEIENHEICKSERDK